jgi:CubicO group peptidase (beta-lactamase class C family)
MVRAVVFAMVLLAAGLRAAPPTIPPQGAAALSTFLRESVARGDVPGVVALVTGRDGVIYHEAFGRLDVARDVAMPRDAIFRIASMTKPVTSLAVMMLVEEGKLKLDDEASKYIPALKSPQVITRVDEATGVHETRPAARPITIRHLLAHTSGIGYVFSNPALAAIQRRTRLGDLDLPLVHEPGERWTYGASTRVLGNIVEQVTSQPIDAFLHSRIHEPLGMRDTSYDVPAAKQARLVTVHQKTDGRFVEQPNPARFPASVRGDGGLVSTAGDYALFLRMLLGGGALDGRRLVSERTVREMTTNTLGRLRVEQQPTADPARSKVFPLGAGRDTWGLGFQLAARPQTRDARSEGSYSWAGIYNTHFWVDPGRQIGVIVLMQVLPFYDDGAIAVLTGFERLVNSHVH